MPFPSNIKDREYNRFFETKDGETAVRTGTESGLEQVGSWDAGTVTYPLNTQEVYKYYEGGIAGTLKGTLTVNYTNAGKSDILNWAWVYP